MKAIGLRGKSVAWFGFLLLVLVSATGCVSETKSGDKTIFTLQLWVPLCVILGGAIAAPAGWFLRETGRLGFGLLIIGPLACIFGISLFTDRAEVDPSSYLIRFGIFGSATHRGQIDEVSQISWEIKRGRRGSTTRLMVLQKKSGEADKIPMGNAIARPAVALIQQYAEAKGVPVNQPPW